MNSEPKRPRDPGDRSAPYRDRSKIGHDPRGPFGGPQSSKSASGSPEDQLAQSIEVGASEIALMWMLHQWALPDGMRSEPLDLQMMNFSSTAFAAIGARFPMLQHAEQEHLWLIYFKGLLAAGTHPQEEMVQAINTVRQLRRTAALVGSDREPNAELDSAVDRAARPLRPGDASDSEVLEQIARALDQANKSRV
jgi:hypothetical protein